MSDIESGLVDGDCNFFNSISESCEIIGLNVVHQNIRSLRENFDSLLVYLNSLVVMPDIIFLSEIWIYDHECVNFSIPNYTFKATCNQTYASGGVAVFF